MGHFGKGMMASTFLWQMAKDCTLADAFFHPAFGGSFLKHQWLVCAYTPQYPNVPAAVKAVLNANGSLVNDGSVMPYNSAVNTIRSVYLHAPTDTDPTKQLPPQTQVTIGDLLDRRHINWAWYPGGYDDTANGKPDPLFQFHHQPFAYYAANGLAGTPRSESHRIKH